MKPSVYVTRRLPQAPLNELKAVCDVEIWDEDVPPPYHVITEQIKGKDGLICLLTDRIDAALMDSEPNLKVISQVAVGYDNIDVPAAFERGIPLGHTPGVLTDATADFAFTLLMAGARRLGEAIDHVRAGKWDTMRFNLLLGQEIHGATLGIIGLGRIGRAMAQRARGFDMKVIYYSATRRPDVEKSLGVEFRALDDLLQEADFVSLHVNLTEDTTGLIDARAFALMKPTAVLINTARGPVVDPDALYLALRDGQIAAAGIDVTEPEPLPAGNRLLELPNLIVAPHIASATVTSRTMMAQMAVRNCIAGVQGRPLPFPVTAG